MWKETQKDRKPEAKEARSQNGLFPILASGFLGFWLPVFLCFLPRLFLAGFQRFRLGSYSVIAGILQGFFQALSFLREGLNFA